MRTEIGTPLTKNKNDLHPENTMVAYHHEYQLDMMLGDRNETYSRLKIIDLDDAHRGSDGRYYQSPWRTKERDKESHDNAAARLCGTYFNYHKYGVGQQPNYLGGGQLVNYWKLRLKEFKAHSWYYPQFLPLYLHLAKGHSWLMWYHRWDRKRACRKMVKVRYINGVRTEFKHTDGDLLAFLLFLPGQYDEKCRQIYNDCTKIIEELWGGWHKVFEEYYGRDNVLTEKAYKVNETRGWYL